MNLYVLKSGSRTGNCSLIEDKKSKSIIMIDCGISWKTLSTSLKEISLCPSWIKAIFITHEDTDHTKGLGVILNRLSDLEIQPKICISNSTKFSKEIIKTALNNYECVDIQYEKSYKVNSMKVIPFKTSHGLDFSCGFRIESDDDSIGYVTDTGKVTLQMKKHLLDCRILAIEANYDTNMIEDSPEPIYVVERTKSDEGHLSNRQAGELLRYVCWEGLEYVVAMHISQVNNYPYLAAKALKDSIDDINDEVKVLASEKDSIIMIRDKFNKF